MQSNEKERKRIQPNDTAEKYLPVGLPESHCDSPLVGIWQSLAAALALVCFFNFFVAPGFYLLCGSLCADARRFDRHLIVALLAKVVASRIASVTL